MRDHHATEAMQAQSRLAWPALRNGIYAASGLTLLGDALNTGLIEAPANGKAGRPSIVSLCALLAVFETTVSPGSQVEGETQFIADEIIWWPR